MALTGADWDFLKQCYAATKDEALQPGADDQLYEPVIEELHLEDPVQLMARAIEFEDGESVNLFSGFQGSGKSTQLLRLKQALEARGYFVLYTQATEYLNKTDPIEIADLMLVMAGAFGEELERQLGADIVSEPVWDRILNFLRPNVTVTEAGGHAGFKLPLTGIDAGADLKFQFKAAPGFRDTLRKALVNRLKELKANVDLLFQDGVKLIRAQHGADKKVVFIFDQFEQIRGSVQTERDVIRNVERIFTTDFDMLKLPYLHLVFTVPPWLKFVGGMARPPVWMPTIHLWHNDEHRTHDEPAWAVCRAFTEKRFGADGVRRLLGDEAARRGLLDRLVDASGGYFRDLLALLRDAMLRARSLPVSTDVVDQVINAARRNLLPLALDDAKWLAEIERTRESRLPSRDPTIVNELARFLNLHYVLYFRNGEEWYDIHPLLRDEVKAVLAVATPPDA